MDKWEELKEPTPFDKLRTVESFMASLSNRPEFEKLGAILNRAGRGFDDSARLDFISSKLEDGFELSALFPFDHIQPLSEDGPTAEGSQGG